MVPVLKLTVKIGAARYRLLDMIIIRNLVVNCKKNVEKYINNNELIDYVTKYRQDLNLYLNKAVILAANSYSEVIKIDSFRNLRRSQYIQFLVNNYSENRELEQLLERMQFKVPSITTYRYLIMLLFNQNIDMKKVFFGSQIQKDAFQKNFSRVHRLVHRVLFSENTILYRYAFLYECVAKKLPKDASFDKKLVRFLRSNASVKYKLSLLKTRTKHDSSLEDCAYYIRAALRCQPERFIRKERPTHFIQQEKNEFTNLLFHVALRENRNKLNYEFVSFAFSQVVNQRYVWRSLLILDRTNCNKKLVDALIPSINYDPRIIKLKNDYTFCAAFRKCVDQLVKNQERAKTENNGFDGETITPLESRLLKHGCIACFRLYVRNVEKDEEQWVAFITEASMRDTSSLRYCIREIAEYFQPLTLLAKLKKMLSEIKEEETDKASSLLLLLAETKARSGAFQLLYESIKDNVNDLFSSRTFITHIKILNNVYPTHKEALPLDDSFNLSLFDVCLKIVLSENASVVYSLRDITEFLVVLRNILSANYSGDPAQYYDERLSELKLKIETRSHSFVCALKLFVLIVHHLYKWGRRNMLLTKKIVVKVLRLGTELEGNALARKDYTEFMFCASVKYEFLGVIFSLTESVPLIEEIDYIPILQHLVGSTQYLFDAYYSNLFVLSIVEKILEEAQSSQNKTVGSLQREALEEYALSLHAEIERLPEEYRGVYLKRYSETVFTELCKTDSNLDRKKKIAHMLYVSSYLPQGFKIFSRKEMHKIKLEYVIAEKEKDEKINKEEIEKTISDREFIRWAKEKKTEDIMNCAFQKIEEGTVEAFRNLASIIIVLLKISEDCTTKETEQVLKRMLEEKKNFGLIDTMLENDVEKNKRDSSTVSRSGSTKENSEERDSSSIIRKDSYERDSSSVSRKNSSERDSSSVNRSGREERDSSSVSRSSREERDSSSVNRSGREERDSSSVNRSGREERDSSSVSRSGREERDSSSVSRSSREERDSSSVSRSGREERDSSSVSRSGREERDSSSVSRSGSAKKDREERNFSTVSRNDSTKENSEERDSSGASRKDTKNAVSQKERLEKEKMDVTRSFLQTNIGSSEKGICRSRYKDKEYKRERYRINTPSETVADTNEDTNKKDSKTTRKSFRKSHDSRDFQIKLINFCLSSIKRLNQLKKDANEDRKKKIRYCKALFIFTLTNAMPNTYVAISNCLSPEDKIMLLLRYAQKNPDGNLESELKNLDEHFLNLDEKNRNYYLLYRLIAKTIKRERNYDRALKLIEESRSVQKDLKKLCGQFVVRSLKLSDYKSYHSLTFILPQVFGIYE